VKDPVHFLLAVFSFIVISINVNGQVVYQDINKIGIYDFLDEMANQQLIDLTTFSKPYSRSLIAQKLSEITPESLNNRQKKELAFFLKDFNKELQPNKDFDKRYDLFYYKDSLFMFTVNPILGYTYAANENDNNWRRYWGAEAYGTIGKHFGFYFNIRDNTEKMISQNEIYLNAEPGVIHKSSGDYSDVRGGITYAWKWGSLGLIKDNVTWGNNNFGSNIFTEKAPSFARLEFKVNPVKWLEFSYYHGWLSSEVRDSSRSYSAGARQRNIDVSKFMAANVVTIKPFQRFHVSLGNSIVYSDNIQPVFFIPVLFFKPADHAVYSGGGNYGGANTQMFFDVSSRNIKNVHLFTSLFIDEISISRMWSSSEHSNFISWKFGAEWTNILNKNIELFAEYSRTNPLTYQHFVNTTTFESNNYNMGHYLRDNAQEIALGLGFRPISRLRFYSTLIVAQKGEEYPYTGTNKDGWGLPFMDNVEWRSSTLDVQVTYELFNDVLFELGYQYREVSGVNEALYTQQMFQGITNTGRVGVHIGF
jgi:hypothetical protein